MKPGVVSFAAAVTLALCGAAHAGAPEPARLFASGALVDRMLAAAMPVAVNGDVDAAAGRFCGADERGRARFVVAAAPRGERGPAAPACKLTAPSRHAALALSAGSTPRQIEVVIEDVALAGQSEPALRALASKPAIPPLPVEGVPAGVVLPQAIALAARATMDGVHVQATPSGASGAVGSGPPLDVAGANLSAALPLSLVNALLAAKTKAGPVLVRVDPETIEIRDVSVTSSAGGLTVSGTATPRSVRQALRLDVDLGGDDLRITRISARGDEEDCGALSFLERVGCHSRNAGRTAAATAVAAALRQRYGGALVRTLLGPQDVRVSVAGTAFDVRGDVLRMAARRGVVEAQVGADVTAARR